MKEDRERERGSLCGNKSTRPVGGVVESEVLWVERKKHGTMGRIKNGRKVKNDEPPPVVPLYMLPPFPCAIDENNTIISVCCHAGFFSV
jgi:hypothetical protein